MKYIPLKEDGLRFRHFHKELAAGSFEYYSIGDIHGCAREYENLSMMIEHDAYSRKKIAIVIQHGDIIDRGPEFLSVFDVANHYGHVCILGNHEHNFALERLGKPCNSNSRKVSHERFEALAEKTQTKVMRFLNSMYNYVVVDVGERTFFLSHAPVKDIERYTDWEHYVHMGNAPYFCMRSAVPIDEDIKKKQQDVTFVYGHQSWEYKDLEEQKNDQVGRRTQYYNVDASCVYGGKLVALRLSDLGVLSVDSNVCVPK